jgi:hypothetical protein
VRQAVLQDDGATVPLTIPRQKGETDLAVREVKVLGRRYIVCRNEDEARKDAQARVALLDGLQRKLATGAKSLVANTGYRRFLAAPEADGFAIDPAKVAADAQFDGIFVLRASLSMSALAVVLRYRNLLTVEQSFLAAKTLLATRPIFHRTDEAIRGHILECSTDCSLFGRMEDWRGQDLRRLRVGATVAFRDTGATWEAVVPSMPLAA